MIKKLVSLAVCLPMIFTSVYAESADSDVSVGNGHSGEHTVYTLTLNDAINAAVDENPQFLVWESEKDDLKKQLSAAKITKANYKNVRKLSASSGFELKYIKGGYYVDSCEKAIVLKDREYEQIKAKIAYDVTQKYYNYKNSEKLVLIAKSSYDLVTENYNNAKLSYSLGLISRNDLDNTELSLRKAKYAYEQYADTFEIAKEAFKIAIRKNCDGCEVVLPDEIVCENYMPDIANDIATAKENRYDILGLKTSYELAKEYFNLTGLTPDSATYTSAYSKFVSAEYNYTNNQDLILLGVKSCANSVTSAKNDADAAQLNLNLKQDNYKIAKVKFDQGMITGSELAASLLEASQAEIENENAKLNYKLAVEKYKYEISIGL